MGFYPLSPGRVMGAGVSAYAFLMAPGSVYIYFGAEDQA